MFFPRHQVLKAMNATFLDETASPSSSRWAATASASPACPGRGHRAQTMTSAASSGRTPLAPFTVVICPIGLDRSPRSRPRPSLVRRTAGPGRRRDPRRPRRAPWRDVRRLGLIGVPHRVGGDRPQGGQVEYQHAARRPGHQGGGGRYPGTVAQRSGRHGVARAVPRRSLAAGRAARLLAGWRAVGPGGGRRREEPLMPTCGAHGAEPAGHGQPPAALPSCHHRGAAHYLRWLGP